MFLNLLRFEIYQIWSPTLGLDINFLVIEILLISSTIFNASIIEQFEYLPPPIL